MRMTKERAIEILTIDADRASIFEVVEAVDLAVEALKEQIVRKWIPCSEMLPEIRFDLNSRTSDTVFVCLENSTMHMAFYCDDDVWRFCESGEAKEPMWDKVIAWMPLPERYGEEASE